MQVLPRTAASAKCNELALNAMSMQRRLRFRECPGSSSRAMMARMPS